jgi:hypothetical protein
VLSFNPTHQGYVRTHKDSYNVWFLWVLHITHGNQASHRHLEIKDCLNFPANEAGKPNPYTGNISYGKGEDFDSHLKIPAEILKWLLKQECKSTNFTRSQLNSWDSCRNKLVSNPLTSRLKES